MRGASSDSKRLADLQLEEAKKALATARFNKASDLATGNANLELAEIELENLNLDLERKRRYLDAGEVKAPVPGRVAFVDVWKGSRQSLSPIQIGESRRRGQDLCRIADVQMARHADLTAHGHVIADRRRPSDADLRDQKVVSADLCSVPDRNQIA